MDVLYHMNDKTLLRIALLGSVVGVVILLLLSEQIGVQKEVISRLDGVPEGKEVEVVGKILRFSDKGKVAFVEIAEQKIEAVNVVLFKDRNITLREGDIVRVTGSVEEYEGKKEILGNRVVLLNSS